MEIYNSIEQLIGKTPLIRATSIESELNLGATLLFKLEKNNPAGSIKDRTALYLIKDAESKGLIKKGGTIIEPTSGNTGIGLAAISAKLGYKTIFTMPDTMSVERIKLLKIYGAEIVLTSGELGMKGAIDKANQLHAEIEGSYIPGQFENEANVLAHYETTGVEIYEQTDGKIDIFLAGIGTGGTLSGTGKYLKEKNKDIKVIGYEPSSSPLITLGKAGAHKIQGIGANFIPNNYKSEFVDEVMTVTDENAIYYAKLMAEKEGILVGISSGGAIASAVELAKKPENAGKVIVAILPDTGERYLSTELFKF